MVSAHGANHKKLREKRETNKMTHTIETLEPVEAARAALKIAQDNYRRARAKYEKLDATIEASEKRLATAQNDLAGYANTDADKASAAARLLLKGAELKLPEAVTKNLAERDALKGEVQILIDGIGALKEQLKTAYADKKRLYTELDAAAAAILRSESDKLATRLATILKEARTIAQRLRAYQVAGSAPRTGQDVFVGARQCISDFGNQMLAQVASPLQFDDMGSGARTRALVEWHLALLQDANAEEKPHA
jgi:predicted  nucleic acid-binding Zn-ribbon protein